MGTSIACYQIRYCHKDHPHAYGDKAVKQWQGESVAGSSPRVWGQARADMFESIGQRIIPTRMGTRIYCDGTTNTI